MKKAAIIIVSIVVFIVILVGAVFMMTSGMTDTATAFFTEIKAKNYTKAYTHLSENFKANTSQDEFVKFLDKSALLKFKDTSWNSRSISGGKGELDGSVVTESGGVVPIKLSFIKENDLWKIYSIYKPKAGLSQDDASGKLPSTEELIALTDQSLLVFAKSVNAKSFKEFYSYISQLWQKQTSVEKLDTAFKVFINQNFNMAPSLKAINPKFDVKPSINSDGVLVVEGHYPGKPSSLIFKLEYVYEGVGWKLLGVSINVKKNT